MAQATHGVHVLGEAPTDLEDNFAGQRLLIDEARDHDLEPVVEYDDWNVIVKIKGPTHVLAELLKWADRYGVYPNLTVPTEEEARVARAIIGRTATVDVDDGEPPEGEWAVWGIYAGEQYEYMADQYPTKPEAEKAAAKLRGCAFKGFDYEVRPVDIKADEEGGE